VYNKTPKKWVICGTGGAPHEKNGHPSFKPPSSFTPPPPPLGDYRPHQNKELKGKRVKVNFGIRRPGKSATEQVKTLVIPSPIVVSKKLCFVCCPPNIIKETGKSLGHKGLDLSFSEKLPSKKNGKNTGVRKKKKNIKPVGKGKPEIFLLQKIQTL